MYRVIPTTTDITKVYPTLKAYYGSDAKLHLIHNGKEIDVDDLARNYHSAKVTRMTASIDTTYMSDFRQSIHKLAKAKQ